MSKAPDPRRDPRSTADLIKAALAEAQQEELGEADIPALSILHARGTREVLDAGRALCASREARLRALGADILGQLGTPTRTFPEECCETLLALLKKETNPGVITSAVFALGHLRVRRAEPEIIALRAHKEEVVRHAVAFALYGSESPAAVQALLELLDDPSEMVRDWAATSIGESVSLDSPRIREALLKHADDEDEMTRAEALHGLARRRDTRVLPFLIKELSTRREDPAPFIEAAKDYLGLGEADAVGTKALLAALKSRLQ